MNSSDTIKVTFTFTQLVCELVEWYRRSIEAYGIEVRQSENIADYK